MIGATNVSSTVLLDISGVEQGLNAGLLCKGRDVHVQPDGDLCQSLDGHVALAPLKRAVVGAMHSDRVSKRFLAVLQRFSAGAKHRT